MQALWGEPWTARSVFVDENEVVPFRGDVTDLWLLAWNARWRSEGKARSREDEMAVSPGFDSSHWLFSLCFRAPSPNTAERSQSINGHQSRKRNFGRQSSISCVWKTGKEGQNACRSCFWKTGKEGQNACRKIPDRIAPTEGSWTPDTVGKETKNRAYAQASFREEIIVNQSQRKAKSKYGICAGFWFDRHGHKAKRSDARFIYIPAGQPGVARAFALRAELCSSFLASRSLNPEMNCSSMRKIAFLWAVFAGGCLSKVFLHAFFSCLFRVADRRAVLFFVCSSCQFLSSSEKKWK